MLDRLCVIGDVHGHPDVLRRVLREAGLVDDQAAWIGGSARLAVLGDLVDRGPDGIGVIELLMRLQTEAAASGGELLALLGNHDLLFVAAQHDPARFEAGWLRNGGELGDRARLRPEHIAWLQHRPAFALVGTDLLAHADAKLYLQYGQTVDEVNQHFAAALRMDDLEMVERLLDEFSEHDAFVGRDGQRRLTTLLSTYAATRFIHGHSPIARVRGVPPESVHHAFVYADGRAVNVDPGLYRGGRGFFFDARATG